MVPFLLVAAVVADWTPARWPSSDPASLELVRQTPINCLLMERAHWSEAFVKAASAQKLTALAVVRPGAEAAAEARRALGLGFAGVALEGDFEEGLAASLRQGGTLVVEITPRGRMRLEQGPVAATYQGLWPGIHVEKDGATKAAPTGAPWIDTNAGFLRFARALARVPIWVANQPPPGNVILPERYLYALADPALVGARWVLAFEEDFFRRLADREPAATAAWKRIAAHLAYWEANRHWRTWRLHGRLALVQDVDAGALLSQGILDMIVARQIPTLPVPLSKLSAEELREARLAINVDPAATSADQKALLRRFAASGATVLSGPPGWKMPTPRPDQVTLDKQDVEKLDAIWREVNSLIGRSNLGVRLFNVSGMLSSLLASPDGKQVVLHLVNFTRYPVENVTAHLAAKFRKATLLQPEAPPQALEVYDVEQGSGVDLPLVRVVASVILE